MLYFKAMLSNGKHIYFSALNTDEAINIGNKKAMSQSLDMIAIQKITKTEAAAKGVN